MICEKKQMDNTNHYILFTNLLRTNTFLMVGYIVSNPLEFLFSLLPFDSDSTTTVLYSVDELSFKYYNSDEDVKYYVDLAIESNEDEDITIVNILNPFIASAYDKVTEDTIAVVVDWLEEESDITDEKQIAFILEYNPFKSSTASYNMDQTFLESLYENANNIVYGDDEIKNAIAEYAVSKLECLYWWGAPGGGFDDGQILSSYDAIYFDCSGLVCWAHLQAGVELERLIAQQYANIGEEVKYKNLETGDVITFTYNNGTSVSHIGIYIGDGMMVHAVGSSTSRGDDYSDKVMISSVEKGSYWYDYIYNCRRLY